MCPDAVGAGFALVLPYFASGNHNCSEISRECGVHKRTVNRYLKKYLQQTPVEKIGRIGRPTKVTPGLKKSISMIVRHQPTITSKEISHHIAEKKGVILSPVTARRVLDGLQYRSVKPRNVAMLTQKQKIARIEWCQKNLNRDWSKVVFSDESFIQLQANTVKYWTKKGQVYQKPRAKDRKKIMFWAAFCIKMKSKIEFIDGIMTGQVYMGILDSALKPLLCQLNSKYTKTRGKYIFQHDNDPKHTCRIVKSYISDNSIDVMDWPSNSPDLNPIENLWAILKRRVEKRAPQTTQNLKDYVCEEWEKIDPNIIHNLVSSMDKRCNEVIAKNGEAIDY